VHYVDQGVTVQGQITDNGGQSTGAEYTGLTYSRGTHSFDIFHNLHWLPVDQRTEFKLATLTYNILNSSQPAYLRSLLNYHTPTRSLRSANTNLLLVPRVRTTFASRSFSIAASTIWNSLPSSIRRSTSADTFRRSLLPGGLLLPLPA